MQSPNKVFPGEDEDNQNEQIYAKEKLKLKKK